MKLIQTSLLAKKQEMTRLWVEDRLEPVTLVKVPQQTVLRHKTVDVDGYSAIVVELESGKSFEFACDESVLSSSPVGLEYSLNALSDVSSVRVVGTSKGKGFQGGMKRHNFGGGPATHGSKFHRALGSTGNRKPRRTIKGQKMAGRMGGDTITLKNVPVLGSHIVDGIELLVLKGSIPGAYNDYVKLIVL